MITVSILSPDIEGMTSIAREQSQFASGVELRLDALDALDSFDVIGGEPGELKIDSCLALIQECSQLYDRVVLTLRLPQDGGMYSHGRGMRNTQLNALLDRLAREMDAVSGFFRDSTELYVDLEIEQAGSPDDLQLCALCKKIAARVIRSCHVFAAAEWSGPDSPERRMKNVPVGELPKIAVMLDDSNDLLRLLELAKRLRPGDQLLLGMGVWGIPSRCAPLAFGSLWTYAHDGQTEAAPGQLSAEYLSHNCRTGEHNSETHYFAIFGNPVMHSQSPAYHSARFREAGLNAAYIPFPLSAGALGIDFLKSFPLAGVSVTIPHKEAILGWDGAAADASVAAVGAANTAIVEGSHPRLFNTDVEGFIQPLLDSDFAFKDSRCAVIGAGGAARAVVFGLLQQGAIVKIYNRTLARAQELTETMQGIFPDACCECQALSSDLGAEAYDLVVQTTQIGMAPDTSADPIPGYHFNSTETVYDIIYTPEYTTMLLRARDAGCRVITGKAMFEAQAAAQSRRFFRACGFTS